jgi:phosphatidate cytidylyltransferase
MSAQALGAAGSALAYGLLSVPASVLAQAGDLFESMVKRFAGVKDSSHLISAHGGFLDKMDSSLFVAPLVYLAATMLAR